MIITETNSDSTLNLFQIKNNTAAKVAFMAFTTAPAKRAARAAAAAHTAVKAIQEREEEEAESSLCEINSSGTQSTIVEVHEEEDIASLKMTSGQQCASTTTYKFKANPKSTMLTQGLSYTSLWPSARDVVISAAPPNTCPDN